MTQVPRIDHPPEPLTHLPARLPEGFHAARLTGGRTIPVACEVWTSPFGWELRLMLDGAMLITSVVPSATEMLALVETWRGALLKQGWS